MTRYKLNAIAIALVLTTLAACGGSSARTSSDEAAVAERESAPTTVEATAPAPAAQAIGAECPAETAVTVTSTNGGYPEGLAWSSVHAAAERKLAGLGGDGTAVVIYISNHERPLAELSDRKVRLEPDEAFLKLQFTNGPNDAAAGDYAPSATPRDPNNVELRVWVTGSSTNKTISLQQPTGEAQLVEAGNRVCGTFELADRWTQTSGTFVAEMAG